MHLKAEPGRRARSNIETHTAWQGAIRTSGNAFFAFSGGSFSRDAPGAARGGDLPRPADLVYSRTGLCSNQQTLSIYAEPSSSTKRSCICAASPILYQKFLLREGRSPLKGRRSGNGKGLALYRQKDPVRSQGSALIYQFLWSFPYPSGIYTERAPPRPGSAPRGTYTYKSCGSAAPRRGHISHIPGLAAPGAARAYR